MKKTIKIPLFSGRVHIYQIEDFTELEKKYNLDSIYDCDAFVFATEDSGGFFSCHMVFGKDVEPSIICHEITHASNMILEKSGVIADFKNDETQAYLNGWLGKMCFKYLELKNK